MIETNWYVITGGPSSGKTKVIEYLSFLGYFTIPEAARILIDIERSRGRTTEEVRSNEHEFQEKVLQMKVDVEDKIPDNQIAFFDRGLPDSIAYYKFHKQKLDLVIKASKERRYKKVFLLEQLPFKKDDARTEDEEFARVLNQLLYDSYSNLGYEIIKVPVKPIDERVKFILSKIR